MVISVALIDDDRLVATEKPPWGDQGGFVSKRRLRQGFHSHQGFQPPKRNAIMTTAKAASLEGW
jgi:hypothetical protein